MHFGLQLRASKMRFPETLCWHANEVVPHFGTVLRPLPEKASTSAKFSTSYRCECMSSQAVRRLFESVPHADIHLAPFIDKLPSDTSLGVKKTAKPFIYSWLLQKVYIDKASKIRCGVENCPEQVRHFIDPSQWKVRLSSYNFCQ